MENLFRNIVYGSMALTLLTTPVAAQQKMNEMWGNGQQAKEINNMGERGHLFEWGNYAMFIHWGLYSQLGNIWNEKTYYGIGEWMKIWEMQTRTNTKPWPVLLTHRTLML